MAYVLTEKKNGIGKLVLNRPEKLNAIIGEMREDILKSLEDFSQDKSVRVVVITGAGRGFCAGGDVGYLADLVKKQDLEGLKGLLFLGKSLVSLIREMPKPVVAAVNGPAAGAGLNLAVACDIRIASTQASFGASFSKIGLHPDWGGSWFLPRLVGPSRACELVFTGEMMSAEEAYRIGLVNHIYPPETFYDEVEKLASLLASRPPKALALAKRLLWDSLQMGMQACLEKEIENQVACFQDKDAYEGIHAFLEKRSPVFTGNY
jgi:enoyl-CoA hydratase/carnithine racemase